MKNLLTVLSVLLLAFLIMGQITHAQCPESFVFDSVDVTMIDGAIDVNNDGYDDIVIGSRTSDAPNGAIYVHSGKTGLLLYTIQGNPAVYGYGLGTSVGGVGDINKDGYDDFVGTGFIDNGSFLFSGLDGSVLRTFPYFADAIDGAGDVNDDGTLDIILGNSSAICDYGGSPAVAGQVVVISGATGFPIFDLWGVCDPIFVGITGFGKSVAGMGDLNSDGYDDFAIGIPKQDVYLNKNFVDHGEVLVISGADGDTLHTWHAGMDTEGIGYDNYGFGNVLDNAGDVDNDGFNDIIIGHVGPTNSVARRDSAWVFSGKYDATFTNDTLIFTLSSNDLFQVQNDFGTSVSAAGDVNLDGYADLAVGDKTRRKVYIFSGLDGTLIDSQGGTSNSYTGGSLAFAGDINNDGKGDIISTLTVVSDSTTAQVFSCIFPEPACLADTDTDSDGYGDLCDNCPTEPNSDQLDTDHDGIGDVCDDCTDSDWDGYGNVGFPLNSTCIGEDNCSNFPNPNQEDNDSDSVGNVCDVCPDTYNPDQADTDSDGFPDSCDVCPGISDSHQLDTDNDGVGDACDNCPESVNANQLNSDTDNFGDVCDNCPEIDNPYQQDYDEDGIGTHCDECTDNDNDGFGYGYVYESCLKDNCHLDYNPDQLDNDNDSIGNVCDVCPDVYNPNQEDWNNDGYGDSCVTSVPAPTGTDVLVDLGNGVTITIASVDYDSRVEISTTYGDDPPAEDAFSLLPGGAIVYHIAAYYGSIPPYTVCLSYDDTGLDAAAELDISLFHHEIFWVPGFGYDTAWIDVTTSRDTVANKVCGVLQELSPFTVGFKGIATDIGDQVGFNIPNDFNLSQNYPNPFNPTTELEYSIPTKSDVLIDIINIKGQIVLTLVNSTVNAGTYKVVWDGNNSYGQKVSSGMYLYRFQAGDFIATKKMIMLK